MNSYQLLQIEKHPGFAIVHLNDSKSKNALSSELITEMDEAFAELEQDSDVVSIVVTGTGKSFIAGGNIKQMVSMTPKEASDYSRITTKLYEKIENSEKIYIAAVNGYAFGGGVEFMLACDIAVASESAKFGLPEVSLGIIPGGGATQRLVKYVGLAQARKLILTGAAINADEALRIGLVSGVIKNDELIAEAVKLAGQISKNSSSALAYAKESIYQGLSLPLMAGIEYENNAFTLCFANEDQKEGMSAFLEKRQPSFSTGFTKFDE